MNLKLVIYIFFILSCVNQDPKTDTSDGYSEIITGAEQIELYLPILEGKNIALVVNHASLVDGTHLLDTLFKHELNIVKVFAPEHGFRGTADNGELIEDGKDLKTGAKLISLYGKNKKPTIEQLAGVELIVFDLQDVGVRFYTYVSTLHYVMEAAAENGIPVLLLDRPNPNAHYVDGPVLQAAFSSFVGMHPVPVVYGMTIGEYAKMINGESWLADGRSCELEVIKLKNYYHSKMYELPVKPSPNLPNLKSILLYPSLCFFEATTVSLGRGTESQFQQIGHPELKDTKHSFTPSPNIGAKNPKHNGIQCFGETFIHQTEKEIFDKKRSDLSSIITYSKIFKNKKLKFIDRPEFFDLLAGSDILRNQIEEGIAESEIRMSWHNDLDSFKKMRATYLMYSD